MAKPARPFDQGWWLLGCLLAVVEIPAPAFGLDVACDDVAEAHGGGCGADGPVEADGTVLLGRAVGGVVGGFFAANNWHGLSLWLGFKGLEIGVEDWKGRLHRVDPGGEVVIS